MKMFLIIGLVYLSTPCLSRWSNPMEILHSYKIDYGTPPNIYTDESTGTSHILWCQKNDSNYCYRRLYSNNTLTPINCFPWKSTYNMPFTISGSNNGKSIFIIFQSPRERFSQGDCKVDPKNCNDIFFSESKNNGDSWSSPIVVPRKDMNDKVERLNPQFLISKNERIWIFYTKARTNDAPCTYVTRSPGASVFSTEKDLPINVSTTISVVYNANMNKEFIDIFYYSYKEGKVLKYYTANNGITWEGPMDIYNCCEGKSVTTLPHNSYWTSPYLFAVCIDGEYVTTLRESVDFGKSWETIEIPFPTYTKKNTISGDRKTYGFFAYADTTVHYVKFSDTTFRKIIRPPIPQHKTPVRLTSTYKYTKFWFWYEISADDKSNSLWVTYIEMTEDMSDN